MSCIKGGICEHGGRSNCLGEPNIKLQEDWKGQAMSQDDMKNSKRIWIYRMYSDVKGMGEYVSWRPEGLGDAKEYIAVTDHDRVVAELKAEVQERDRLVAKYLDLENEFANESLKKANKLEAIIRQMSRHENLNKEDMPLVCEILQREVNSILSKLDV